MAAAVLGALCCGVSPCTGSYEEGPDGLVTDGHSSGAFILLVPGCLGKEGWIWARAWQPFEGASPDCVFLSQIRKVREETQQERRCSVPCQ